MPPNDNNKEVSKTCVNDTDASAGSSPEAAGVARGAVKTASTLSRRAVIGRLPKPAVIPKARPMPRAGLFPKKVPMKQVVKVSDRISTGFDAYDAASNLETGNDKIGKRSQWKQLATRAASFSGMLLKNTILGAGLFEAFEKTIVYLDEKNDEAEGTGMQTQSHRQTQRSDAKFGDSFSRTSVQQHFAAGAVGGSVHSFLLLAFDSGSHIKQNGMKMITASSFSSISSYSAVHTFHHGFAHGLLFSSYEGIKRLLFAENLLHRLHMPSSETENNGQTVENSVIDVMKISLAGGIAGQIQHIASHYSEALLIDPRLKDGRIIMGSNDIKRAKIFITGPSMKSILLAFPPSAIGFIAFEFGKQLIA